jgi:large subunit ribosomal protein L15
LKLFPAGTEVTPEVLAQAHLIDPGKPVVLLGRGQMQAALTVKVHRVSRSARAKLEKAGGSVEILPTR